MTHFLITDDKPEGYKLEDILTLIRRDMILRATKIVDDPKPQAKQVLENNIRILGLLSECIAIAENSTKTLDKEIGPPVKGKPRIGSV
ncbi:MAG: hypothetical protein QNJ30_12435 [Kiloniellales bacterium]|nr:hypothetical protein [Kiloniellales bacterium]